MGMNCQVCSNAVYRLSLRGPLARWRARLTRRRPYACASCGWQGWLTAPASQADVLDQLPWFRAREPAKRNEPAERNEKDPDA
jgi:hypothetical protein